MKKNTVQIVSTVLVLVVLTTALYGCQKPSDDDSEPSDRIVLTLATFNLDMSIRTAVVSFNTTNPKYRIDVIDYAEFNTDDDWRAGLTRLSTEMISGNIPDIIDVANLPFNHYVAKGMLLDIYPLIESDLVLKRSDFIETVLCAAEINGELYRIFPFFSVGMMLGNPQIVGSYPGWNINEIKAVLEANPDADYPVGQMLTKPSLLHALFMYGIDEYVDYSAGTVNFDNDEFISLLEFVNALPTEFTYGDDFLHEHELIAAGRQIIVAGILSNLDDIQLYRAMFGSDIVFKGMPAANRNGFPLFSNTSFAITAACKDVDGAWAFLRTLFLEDWQNEFSWFGLPVNKNVFDSKLKELMIENEYGPRTKSVDGFEIEIKPLTQSDVNQIMEFVNSVSGSVGQDEALWAIIYEGAIDFFSRKSSAQDTARVIQSRASIYISEQNQ